MRPKRNSYHNGANIPLPSQGTDPERRGPPPPGSTHPMKRPCIEPGCPRYTERTRCPGHERRRDAQRGTRQQRGYDATHDGARRTLAATLPAECGYGCGRVIVATDRWVAAHVVDGDPSAGWLASCVTCNERAKRRHPS